MRALGVRRRPRVAPSNIGLQPTAAWVIIRPLRLKPCVRLT
jgi:hypothetical protein